MILCEYRNRRRHDSGVSCYNQAERFLMDIGGRSRHTIAICARHYSIMSDDALRAWKEISREEYEVSKVHES
jgi:hypothetical protein